MLRRVTFLFLAVIFILVGCADGENEIVVDKWKQSPLFESGGYSMIGVKDKIGFIYDNSELIRFYPNKENKYIKYKIDNDKLCTIFFTSGTTGANKGVMLSQKNIACNKS